MFNRLPRWRGRRLPVIVAVVVVVLAAAGTAFAMTRSSSTTAKTEYATAAYSNLQNSVSASGTLDARQTADLDFEVSGRVTKVLVKSGDPVKKGEVLAKVDKTSLDQTLAADNEELTAAEATLTSDTDDSASATQISADDASVTSAKATVKSAKTAVSDATLKATITGEITSLDLTVGEEVGSSSAAAGGTGGESADSSSSDSSSSSSTDDVVIETTKSFVVDASVDDTEVSDIKKGQSVEITPSGATSSVTGTVKSVSSVPSSTSGVTEFPIVITVSGHPTGVYVGADATMTITTAKVTHALTIPTEALSYSGSSATVQLVKGGSTVTTKVTVGKSFGLESQIISGLSSGDKVKITVPTFTRTIGGTSGTTGRSGFGEGFTGGTGGFTGGTGGGFTGGTGGGFPGGGS